MLGRAEIESQLPELNGNVYRVWVWQAPLDASTQTDNCDYHGHKALKMSAEGPRPGATPRGSVCAGS